MHCIKLEECDHFPIDSSAFFPFFFVSNATIFFLYSINRFLLKKKAAYMLLLFLNWVPFFPKKNLIHLDHTLYPYFNHPMHAIINRNIAYTKNYIAKCKKCFAFLKKNLSHAVGFPTLSIFIAKWISKDNSNAVFVPCICIYTF